MRRPEAAAAALSQCECFVVLRMVQSVPCLPAAGVKPPSCWPCSFAAAMSAVLVEIGSGKSSLLLLQNTMHGYKLIRETAPLISHELLKELTPPQLRERVTQLRQSIVTKLMQHFCWLLQGCYQLWETP